MFQKVSQIKTTNSHFKKVFLAGVLSLAYIVGSLFAYTAQVEAAIPKYINFQGKLTAVSGGTNVANGTYAFEFKLYDALTSGSLLWTETFDQPSGSCGKLTVTNGVFNAKLGTCASLSSVDFTGGSVYLSVNFAPTGTSYDGEMSPRKQLVSSAYAFVANGVSGDGAVNTTNSSATALTVAKAGTDYALQVDTSAGSAVTGLKVTSAAAAGGLALTTLSTATDESLTINAKGAGQISLGSTSTGNINIGSSGTGDILLGGGSGSTGCTVTNSTGAFACTAGGSFSTLGLSGAITGATGITSSGTIQFSSLTSNGPLYTSAGNGTLTTTAPTSGVIGYWSRSGTTLSATTANDIVTLNTSNTTGADLGITNSGVYTGTGILNLTANSATTGTLSVITGNGLTTGSLLSLSSNGTGALTGQKGLNISLQGTNGTGSQTTYAAYLSNTHAGSGTNVGLYATASGGTNNYAAIFAGGNVGVNTTSPSQKLEVSQGNIKAVGVQTPAGFSGTATTGGSLATNNYYYAITAVDATGESSPTYTYVNVGGANNAVNLSWTASPLATSYNIYRSTSPGGVYVSYNTASTSFNDTGAAGGSSSPPVANTAYGALQSNMGINVYNSTGLSLINTTGFAGGYAIGPRVNIIGDYFSFGSSGEGGGNGAQLRVYQGLDVAGSDNTYVSAFNFKSYYGDAATFSAQPRSGQLFLTDAGSAYRFYAYPGVADGAAAVGYTLDTSNSLANASAKLLAVRNQGSEKLTVLASGNLGVGDTSPAALLTVGSGDLFQVNSSGAIAAATGVTSSGTITFSGLGGGGTQCLQTSNTGVISGTGSACGAGSVTWNSIANPTGTQSLTFDDGELNSWTVSSDTETFHTITANSLTTGKILSASSSSLSSGTLIDLAVTGTAAASNTQTVLNVATSGANGTSTQTTYGAQFANTHSGTSSTNIAAYFTASGGTDNYAIIVPSTGGNSGFGTTTPTNLSGAGSYFGNNQINPVWVSANDPSKVTALVVQGNLGQAIQFIDQTGTAKADFGYYSSEIYIVNRAGGGTRFYNNSTNVAMFLDSNANLGLGTSTSAPASRLEVKGASGQLSTLIGDAGYGTGYAGISVNGTFASNSYTLLGDASNLMINRPSGGDMYFREGNTTQMILKTSTGNLGIGDTSPAALLTVGSGDLFQVASNGNLTSSNAGTWTFSNDTNIVLSGGLNGLAFDTDVLSIDATSNRVGFGTTSPSYPVDVVGTARATDFIAANTVTSQDYLYAGQLRVHGTGGSGEVQLWSNSNQRLTVLSSGEIGIGDTSPAALLTVGSGDLFQVNSSGNLIFNQTSPTISIGNTGSLVFNDGSNTLCTIADTGSTGNLSCTGNITGASTGTVGYWSRSGTLISPATSGDSLSVPGAGANSEKFGDSSLAAGARASAFGKSASGAGDDSTAIGYASSASSTNATAIGASATADGNSTAIGKSTTATGTANIAIGSGASATTGTQMTVIGGTSTGSNGVLIGKNSTGGHYGVGIGVDITLSGSESIAIGNLTVNAYTNSIALGRGATTTANNQMVVGAGSYAVSDIYFGKGVTNATPTAYTINGTGGSGTDIAGAAINIAGGKGTGAGVGGNIVFQYAPASGSGSSLNSLQTACSISGTNGSLSCPGVGSSSERFGASSTAAGNNSLAVGNNSSAAGAQSVAIGKGASAQYAGSISIGYNATQTNAVADNYGIAIGYSASSDYTAVALGGIAVSSGNQNVAVGYDAQANGPYQSTALGGGARANATWGAATAVGWAADAVGSASVALGSSSTSAGYSVVIGMAASAGNSSSNLFNIAIGQSATISSSYSGTIVMGAQSAATGNAQFIAGSSNYPINDIYFGKGATNATATAYTINGTGGSGTNIAGADLIFAGGKGTGNSAGGDILFKTSDAGVSGATLQSLTTKMILTELGYLGVGVSVPTHNLDVANGISIRNGNSFANYTSNQIVMSYAGSDSYRHAINTRHDSASQAGNAIDFLLWDYGTDSAGTTGTKRVMTLQGDGNVGINITTPTARLQSNSSGGVAPLLLRYDSGGGYFDLLKATYNGGGYSEISSTQPIQVSATGSMVLSTSSGYVRVQDGTSGGSIRLVTAGNVETLQMTSAGVIQTLNSSNLTIGTNSTSAVTIDTSQRVGIGDTSPAALLTVGSGDLFQVASNGNLTSSNAGTWTFSNDTNFALSGGVNGLAFDTNTFSVDASNNRIGLGTTSPSYQLDIRGGVENNAIYADTSSAQTALNIVGGDTNGYYPTLSLCPLANCNVGGGSIQGYDGISIVTRGYIRMMNESAYTNTVKDFLSIEHQTTGTPANGLGSAILFRLESSTTANLDSGRISNYWTDVTHATRTSNLGFSTVNSGGSLTEKMTLQGNGNFGIGTTGPSAMLHVVKSDNGTDEIAKFFANNLTQGIGINYNSILAIGSNTNQNISITPKGSGDIILTSGRTGVAYTPTSGTAALMVNGAAAVGSSTYLNASAPTNGLIVEGNVGIGASSLGSKLQVNADASGIGLIVRANATTPGDLTQWHNSSGLVLAKVTSAGVFEVGSSSAANDGRINVRASNNTIAGYLTVGGGGANELEIQAYDTLTLGASNASLLTVKPTDPVDWRVYSGNTLTLGGYTGFGGEVVMKNLQDSSEVFHAYLAGTQMVTFPNGNVGIGDTSPAALLTVGSGDLFQVNSSGAIAAATGITSSGTITFSGLGGGGTQCVNVSNTGVLGTTTCGGALTPWTSDIDADGYDLNDLSNILFRETTGAPTSTDVGLFRDNSGDLNLNVLSGKTFNVQVAGTDEYNFSSSALAMNSNNITGVGTAITATAGLTVTATSANLALVTATSGNITLAPASTGSVQITSGVATGTTTSSGFSLVANSVNTGTAQYISTTALTSGNSLQVQGSGATMQTGGELIDLALGANTVGAGLTITSTGAYTGTGAADGLINITANGLTSGYGMQIAHTTSVISTTGSLMRLSSSSIDTGTTGTLLSLSSTGSTAGTIAMITNNTSNFTGTSLSVSNTGLTSGAGLVITGSSVMNSSGRLIDLQTSTSTQGVAIKVANSGVYTNTAGLVQIGADSLTTGVAQTISVGGITSGAGLRITGTSGAFTMLTGGSILDINHNNARVGAGVRITSVGSYNGTAATDGLLNITADSLSSGHAAKINVNNMTSGSGLVINTGANLSTGGKLIDLQMGAATAGNGLNIATTGVYTGTGLAVITANSATTGNVFATSATGLTTGYAQQITLGSGLTTGGAVNISGGVYAQSGASSPGYVMSINFTNLSTNSSGQSSVYGINMTPSLSSAGTGIKNTRGIVIAPTNSGCAVTGGVCNYFGVHSSGLSMTNSTTGLVESTALYASTGSATQNTAAGSITFYGTRVEMGTLTQTTGSVIAYGQHITTGGITTAGTMYGSYIAASGVGAGTLQGLNISNITGGAGTETAISIGSGWDTGISNGSSYVQSAGTMSLTSANTTQVTTASALALNVNSLTSGTGLYTASSTLTSGKLVDLQVSGTAAAASQTALNILTTGANGTAGITTYGAQISNTHSTNTSTNVGLLLNATGGATANYALVTTGGNVGIGTTAPGALLTIEDGTSSDQLRIGDTSAGYYYKLGRNTTTGYFEFDGTQSGFRGYIFNNSGNATFNNADNFIVSSNGSANMRITSTAAGASSISGIALTNSTQAYTWYLDNRGSGGSDHFGIANNAGTEMFAISTGGNFTLSGGATSATTTLDLGGTGTANAVCHTTQTGTNDEGLVDCTSAPAADFAEMYPVTPDAEVGDVVVTGTEFVNTYETAGNVIDWTKVKGQVVRLTKSAQSYAQNVVGIVSDNYGDFISTGYNIKPQDNPKSIALVGRVPVKVSTENGEIKAGDFLTSSATLPGFAMKATTAGPVIGMALADFNSAATGKVMVFVKATTYNGVRIESELAGLDFDYTSNTSTVSESSEQILTKLISQIASLNNDNLSELNTDLVIANAEVISPNVTTGALRANTFASAASDGGIEVESATIFKGGLKVDNIGSLGNLLTFLGDTEFIGTPYLNKDTAGFAVVSPGATSVDITFTNTYAVQPIVGATISFEQNEDLDEITDSAMQEVLKQQAITDAQNFLTEGVSYVVTNKSSRGFTIVLNKPATKEVKFSWTAFAVKNANVFTSIESSPSPDNSGILNNEGIVSGDSTGAGDLTPPATREPDPTPTPDPVVPAATPQPDPQPDVTAQAQ